MSEQRPVIGIDIGGTKTLSGVVTADGRVVARRRIETPQSGPFAVVEALADGMRALLAETGLSVADVLGLGVGAPGPLDPWTGVVFEPPNLAGWRDVPLATLLADATDLPAFVENDANAAALAEAWMGAGRGVADLIYITVSTGIGGGLIMGGSLYHGVSGTAGEVGHMTLDVDGPLCPCGRPGHLEGLASGQAIARMAAEALDAGRPTALAEMAADGELTAERVAAAAAAGDAVAQAIYERAGEYLGAAVASLVNVLNPALVVVGGGVSKAGEGFLAPMRRAVTRRAFDRPAAAVRIVPAALGDDAGVIGAAAVVYARSAVTPR